MDLKVLTPERTVVDQAVTKVIAEGADGSFCLLPRHADFVAALVPGLLEIHDGGTETFFAVDEGILVKVGPEVLVSARRAVRGDDLEHLRETVEHEFRALDEHQRQVRAAAARLEADLVRRFMELSK
ncbi:MAG TPA: F0F1 ATP synthase subunit epsilon [Planctomycetota bacterium]|nr:F0F1 ATP synthase subunit epsilon [Planctomycetota bacterium]